MCLLPQVVLENLLQPLHSLPVEYVLDVQVVDLQVHLLVHLDDIHDHLDPHLEVLLDRLLHVDVHVQESGLELVPVGHNHLVVLIVKSSPTSWSP